MLPGEQGMASSTSKAVNLVVRGRILSGKGGNQPGQNPQAQAVQIRAEQGRATRNLAGRQPKRKQAPEPEEPLGRHPGCVAAFRETD